MQEDSHRTEGQPADHRMEGHQQAQHRVEDHQQVQHIMHRTEMRLHITDRRDRTRMEDLQVMCHSVSRHRTDARDHKLTVHLLGRQTAHFQIQILKNKIIRI